MGGAACTDGRWVCQVGGAACTDGRQGCVRWVELHVRTYVPVRDRGVSGGWSSMY